jgi:PKHD-type hydroxylase
MIYQIHPRDIPGKELVSYWEGFLSKEELDMILAQPEWLESIPARVGDGDGGAVQENARRSDVSWLGFKPELAFLWDKFSRVISDVNSRFYHYDLTGFYEPMQLGVYTEHQLGHYDWHTDNSVNSTGTPRKLSMSLLLSDPSEFEGGLLQVKTTSDEIQTLDCAKGRAWFFPSYTLHRVTPVTKGIRRSLVLWIGGPPFR